MEAFMIINENANRLIWGIGMIIILIGTGIYLTIFTRFYQVRKIKDIFICTIESLFRKSENNISPFAAVSTALAGTIGTGNIAGVATAIVAGGAGSIFWMWISSFFGMMTKFAEVTLAVHYRSVDENGKYMGGPMYYIEKGVKSKGLATIFAVLCVLSSFGIGNITQVNSITESVKTAFFIPSWITATVTAIICGIVFLGGGKRITKVTEMVVPFMAVFYTLGTLIFLYANKEHILSAFSRIIDEAFDMRAISGGFMGVGMRKAMQYGVSRGLFTNEAGLGSAPIAHAGANCRSSVEQGMWGIVEVFIDTILMCTLTTLVILTANNGMLYSNTQGLDGAALTTAAFSTVFGNFGGIFIAFGMVFFAIAAILGWGFYAEKAINYLTPKSKWLLITYRFVFIFVIACGGSLNLKFVWSIADTLNGLMLIPNLLSIILLSPNLFDIIRHHEK